MLNIIKFTAAPLISGVKCEIWIPYPFWPLNDLQQNIYNHNYCYFILFSQQNSPPGTPYYFLSLHLTVRLYKAINWHHFLHWFLRSHYHRLVINSRNWDFTWKNWAIVLTFSKNKTHSIKTESCGFFSV